MWYVYTMEFYSATNNNEILSFAGKWMELKNIILSTAILWKTGHTKGRLHMRGREREREREREGEYDWCTSYTRMDIEILNLLKSP
jgi:hypothetical protein